ncbi:AAA family ATPase [Streptomyces sp. NBC_00893]|uniref:AAA family ATPase n=1 Tax=Streptomyces sp. NBC_00893 TaxID=2975862 RepID=UPI0022550DC4|nr:AAA family ATPase [Streptomyces sp. NBC_00893]MCX4851639.1 AAA family ATPase [Streptomyces sp. NBC_00893]
MIIWLNGTFGAGKTTTAKELTSRIPSSRLFDAEKVGEMLWHVLGVPEGDFQDFPPWRGLVVETARQVLDYVGGTLVVTQTVLVEQYWREIHEGLTEAGIAVHHFLLDSDQDTLVERIETDTKPESVSARQWRLDHLAEYERARTWLHREAQVIDTTDVVPSCVAEIVIERIQGG